MREVTLPAGAVPDRIGRYRIRAPLGRGASSVVFSAIDETIERVVALKTMRDAGADDARTSFYREARAIGQLAHPNIVTVYDIGESDGCVYLVLELLEGTTLGAWLEQQPPPTLEERVAVFRQIADGLAAAHCSGVVHRDLKPANLFVQHDGTAKILDFGVARLQGSAQDGPSTIVGTPDFMAPEQTRGQQADARSDIFSLGGVMYLSLTGRKPFQASDLAQVLHHVQHTSPPTISPAEAPPDLIRIVSRCLEKKPGRRYQSAEELVRDLARLQGALERDRQALVGVVAQELQALRDALERRREAGVALGLEYPDPSADMAIARLAGEFGAVAQWCAAGDVRPEVSRREAERIVQAVQGLREEVQADLGSLLRAGQLASTTAETADATLQVSATEEAYQLFPSSPVVLAALEAARRRLANKRAIEAQAGRVLDEARAALADWHTATARRLCAEARAACAWHAPTNAEADSIEAEVSRLEAEEHAATRGVVAEVERLLTARRYADAYRVLRGRRLRLPESRQTVEELERRLQAAIDGDAARSAEWREAATAMQIARQRIARGETDAALAGLQEFLVSHPEAAEVRPEVERLVEAVQTATARAQVTTRANALVATGELALQSQELDQAIAEAQAALALNGEHAGANDLLRRATDAMRQHDERRRREHQLRALLTEAERELSMGRFESAAHRAQQAADAMPEAPEPRSALAQIGAARRAAEARVRQRRLAEQRRHAAEPALLVARIAVREGDWARACWAAENALAKDPSSAEAQQILAHARSQPVSSPTSASSSVMVGDDTVTFAPMPVWLRALTSIRVFIREHAPGRTGRAGAR